MTVENEKSKSGGAGKTLAIVLLILILVPIITIGVLYFSNSEFQYAVNGAMSNAPGGVGQYFADFPTKSEQDEQIKIVAEYNLDISNERAVEKLVLLKAEDSGIYDEVIREMLRINPNKTEKILTDIRSKNINEDILTTTVNEIENEATSLVQELADYLSTLSVSSAVQEINDMIDSSINGHKNAAAALNLIEDDDAAKIIDLLEDEDAEIIYSYLPEEKERSIKLAVESDLRRKSELKNFSEIYSSKDAEDLILLINSSSDYPQEELVDIYTGLGPKKAGEVLSKTDNDDFVFGIIEDIRSEQLILYGEDNLTQDILKSLKIYKEYDDNVKELVEIYSNMTSQQIADLLQNMLINSSPAEVYLLDNGDTIVLTDEELAIEILSSFPKSQIGEIMGLLDNALSTELTRKLALPE